MNAVFFFFLLVGSGAVQRFWPRFCWFSADPELFRTTPNHLRCEFDDIISHKNW